MTETTLESHILISTKYSDGSTAIVTYRSRANTLQKQRRRTRESSKLIGMLDESCAGGASFVWYNASRCRPSSRHIRADIPTMCQRPNDEIV